MGEGATDWLPKEAFTDDAVKSALSASFARWSQRWFARQGVAVSVVRSVGPQAPEALHIRGAVAAAELSGFGKRHLMEAALHIDLSGQTLIEADHRVLDALAAQIVEDLVSTLDETFGGQTTQGGEQISIALSIAGNDMLAIAFPRHVLVPMLKARLGKTQQARSAPRSRMEALKPTRLVAKAMLGRVELAATDLKGLSVGDVLILDRALHEPVELRVAGSDRHIGRGRLVRNGDQVSIQF